MKRATLFVLAAAALAAVIPARPAAAKELAGVNMPETLSVGDKTLKLNGLGLRKKAFIKVYVGGLYLEVPSKDAAAILASDGAKAVRAKPESSLVVACRLVAEGAAQAVMSPGNTGAMLAAATLHIRRLPGVIRPGLAVVLPSARGPLLPTHRGPRGPPAPRCTAGMWGGCSARGSCTRSSHRTSPSSSSTWGWG